MGIQLADVTHRYNLDRHSQGAAGPPSNEQVAKSIGPLGEKQLILINLVSASSRQTSSTSGPSKSEEIHVSTQYNVLVISM